MDITLEHIIKQYVNLKQPNSKGWQSIRCHVCDDHTNKGLRGNFLFDNDVVVYKCWNCSIAAVYNPHEHDYIPEKMLTVLNAFNIPETEYQQVVLSSPAYITGIHKHKHIKNKNKDIEPKELKLPDIFYYLKDAPKDNQVANAAIEHLNNRNINPDDYPFMLSKKAENPRLFKWLGRLIIPIYKNNKLIYYIGRTLYNNDKKYETPAAAKEHVLYGFDKLFEHKTSPLLIVEGWFDAFAIDGVAILGNVITDSQAQWLNKSNREKIYIPDKKGDGSRAAEQALDYGWHISTPDIGSSIKDMDEAAKKYGKLYVIRSINECKSSGFEALTRLRDYCE